ncbi:type III-B CRISPR module RAMP protein Cmr1 [Akkermansiaceae bacterium]|nr:type III-B CRISPR module RAMP protein Cmr1 [Akkermansiaceae bacterium]
MITESIQFECITPCMCAGANQSVAEVRPSAIRGALRWWFRALGGSPEQEIETFGGGEKVRASSVQIRVSNLMLKPVGQLPKPNQPTSPKAYILYFASIAGGNTANFGTGPRWNAGGMLGTGTAFTLHLRQLRTIQDSSITLLQESLQALSHYGSIGLRVTRGFGAIQAREVTSSSFSETDQLLESRGFIVRRSNRTHRIWDAALEEAGKWLQGDLRKEFGAGGNKKDPQASALGSIKPVRQTSAVHLRPIQLDGNLIFSAFEAPHSKILGEASKRQHPQQVLKNRDFTQGPPT